MAIEIAVDCLVFPAIGHDYLPYPCRLVSDTLCSLFSAYGLVFDPIPRRPISLKFDHLFAGTGPHSVSLHGIDMSIYDPVGVFGWLSGTSLLLFLHRR